MCFLIDSSTRFDRKRIKDRIVQISCDFNKTTQEQNQFDVNLLLLLVLTFIFIQSCEMTKKKKKDGVTPATGHNVFFMGFLTFY